MIYTFVCKACRGELEVERRMDEEPTGLERRMECPNCGGDLRRIFTTGVIIPANMRSIH